jgi:hypothetical protein
MTYIQYETISSYVIQGILFSWTIIERHILIFHDRWMITKKRRFFCILSSFHFTASLLSYVKIILMIPVCNDVFFVFMIFMVHNSNFSKKFRIFLIL